MLSRIHQGLLGLVGRSSLLSTNLVGLTAFMAERLGAAPEIITEAVEAQADRELARTLQILVWAASIARSAPGMRPRSFMAADHLTTEAARRAAATALRPSVEQDPELRRQWLMIDDDLSNEERSEWMRRDLAETVQRRSVAPRKGVALDPNTQLHIVTRVTELLEARAIRPFLMTGTLLGAVREGHFMEYDYDIDLGVLPGVDRDAILEAAHTDPEFEVTDLGTRIVLLHRSGIRLDIFEHYERDGLVWHGTKIHEWWNSPIRLAQRTVGGVPLWAPADAEQYLEECYGEWRRPVPFYEITFDTPNRRFQGGLPAVRHLYGECRRAIASGDRWTAESTARELRDEFDIDVTEAFGESPLLRDSVVVLPIQPPDATVPTA